MRIKAALERALALVRETGARGFEPQVYLERAALARLAGDEATHERELREAHRLFTQMGASIRAARTTSRASSVAKPVALMGATPGRGGTTLAHAAWLPVLRTSGLPPRIERPPSPEPRNTAIAAMSESIGMVAGHRHRPRPLTDQVELLLIEPDRP